MLSQQLLKWSALAALIAVYVKYSGLQLLKSPEYIAAELTVGRPAQEPFLRLLGTGVLIIAASACAFNIAQAVISAIRRYLYRPTVLPPLQPLSEEGRRQRTEAEQQHQGSRAGGSSSAAQQQQGTQQQQLPRPASDLDLDERRRRALDALQRKHDEKTAAVRDQQKEAEAQRAARKAQAAQEAAQRARAATAAADASRAAEARRWEQWEHTVLQHYDGSFGSNSTGGAGANTPPVDPAAAAAQREEDRLLREEQDREFHESLSADQQRQQQKQQQQLLKALKAALQQQLPPEASADPTAGPDRDARGLTIRVRLPDGTSAVRYFAPAQGFSEVQDWVYGLPGMPLWGPGSWQLVSSFPKRQLQAASGVWAPGGSQPDLAGYIASMSAAAVWSLSIRTLQGDLITVRVHGDTSVLEVKQQVEQYTGISPAQQRLIFAGQVLSEDKTLQDYSITPEHMLQLALPSGAVPARTSSSGGGGAALAAGDAEADESGGEGSNGLLVVRDVRQLRDDVAHGASQLALFVVAVAGAV